MTREIPKSFPKEEVLKRMRKILARKRGSQMLRPDASAIDRAKYAVCKEFVKYKRIEEITQRTLAKRLGVSEARVSEVVHYRIQKLTLDQLFKYLERIKPDFVLKVA